MNSTIISNDGQCANLFTESHADQRHEPNDDCHGRGVSSCPECRVRVCSCERAFGHDCEEPGES